ncbi:[protein-PII] uridylyltransferase [Virgisporangium ochraceum]|uniref:Bifunctional uridylyltransferase/uridylyl-removing enzyme n=1 Tax=Virgisporangium ochraceum TaxID=65505 RepID=A0A8J3ZJF6_9ACTN|nr:[protein-PII] uridylyltransferase [Virgisporangium ochraceum]GIJ65192.1 bifunctional uridylyltransferase/uridylyl-removing enzyme [Virgisporangium ochraceum]
MTGTAPTPGIPGVGAAARVERANALDPWLATLLPDLPGAALVAVGGLGRREMAPYSDLDLVLVHTEDSGIDPAQVWYPIWDAGFKLDHSARTVEQALAVAETDVKAALGLLDARLLAGDRALAEKLHKAIVLKWRREARRILPTLRELTEQRWDRYGELAFLLEGDLKEARGGLRDVGVLRGLGYAGVADGTRPAVRAAHNFLLDVRDALHVARGRRGDHLLAQERAEVARQVELPDGDALLRRITEAARTIAYASDDAWRAANRWLAPRAEKTRTPLARDVIEQEGEAVLARTAVTARPDPALALRVAAAAARSGRPIARPTLEWLARYAQPPTRPWPPGARYAFFALLGAGPGLVQTWEACDRYGLVTGWLPEWARIRSAPQHNPVHRFTIDRHLVETAANAAAHAREVSRPDLLVLCALLHDIGKGLPGDHSTVGAPIAAGVAERIGLPPADVEIVQRVVRQHLLLPDTATRRDLADPITIDMVAEAVRDTTTLDLLYALARADAFATGPAAWSTWKGRLVDELVRRVGAALAGRAPEPQPSAPPRPEGPLPAVRVTAERVTVTAQDRRGLLAAVAGCLALHRLEVMTADTSTLDKLAYVSCAVQPRFGGGVDVEGLTVDLRRALAGELPLGRRLAPRSSSDAVLKWHPATDAAVLEVRAADSPGLLWRVASALENAGADVRAARISTLGAAVVDAFYLEGTDWTDDRRKEIETAVLDAVSGSSSQ